MLLAGMFRQIELCMRHARLVVDLSGRWVWGSRIAARWPLMAGGRQSTMVLDGRANRMTEKNPPIGVIGVTPRGGKDIYDEIDSCDILLKTSGIPPLRIETLNGYGKIYLEAVHLDRAIEILVNDGMEAAVWTPP